MTPGVARGERLPLWCLPALALLLAQVTLYAWMAPRGFDFTDESYYFHNYLHWRDFTGTVTFFGAYFELPYRALGGSVAAMRMLSLALVLGSAALLMREALSWSLAISPIGDATGATRPLPHRYSWLLLAGPMASAMLYFGYLSTLRAPSYNVLSLTSMALATACLLRTLRQQRAGALPRAAPVLYGVALGACFLSKATTSLTMALAHLLFFAAVNRTWNWKWLAGLVGLIGAGAALNLLLLSMVFPGWLASLREGIVLMKMRGGYAGGHLLGAFAWEVRCAIVDSGPWLLAAGALFALLRRRLGPSSRSAIGLLAVAMVLACVGATIYDHQSLLWLPAVAATALALWSLELLALGGQPLARSEYADFALMALLLLLPLAFSFGTNMLVLGHSAIAALFAFAALYLRLYRLFFAGLLGRAALAACVTLLCLPGAATQYRALTDSHYTYRQHSALGRQDLPLAMGPYASTLLLDGRTHAIMRAMKALMADAGFRPGQDILDLSGDSPGMIWAVGGNPLGSPWIIGRYPGSEAAAERTMEKSGTAKVRGAWLFTSRTSRHRIAGWESMLARQAGAQSHQLVASITFANPYPWLDDAPDKTIDLQVWRPALLAR